ncbi:MAG: hypothetical protein P1U83_17950 [Roseovarius sp.]|nr:hypothetical protein [Roseovarius sp.]
MESALVIKSPQTTFERGLSCLAQTRKFFFLMMIMKSWHCWMPDGQRHTAKTKNQRNPIASMTAIINRLMLKCCAPAMAAEYGANMGAVLQVGFIDSCSGKVSGSSHQKARHLSAALS